MRLADKTAIVTGAGSGIGRCIAETFAREGARVAVLDVKADAAKAAAADIRNGAIALACDVARKAEIDAALQATLAAFGGLDILVNNAGVAHVNKPVTEIDEAELDRVLAVNVKGLFLFSQAAVSAMRRRGGGVIINIGSTAGLRPRPGLSAYNATKGAVNLVSKSMAVELAPDRIRVCALAPVIGETGLTASFMGGDTPELRAQFMASVPLGRMSTPRDVATAALFLASDEADFLTGVVLEVDGGRCV